MTKKSWTTGELITKTELDKLLQDLKSEALYGGISTKTGNYVITDTDGLAIVIANASGGTVQITLPAATGTGRILIIAAKNISNAVTIVRAGSDVINAAGTGYTIVAAWGFAIIADIAAGQWLELLAWQAS